MGRAARYDWPAIRASYVEEGRTYAAVAELHELPIRTVESRAAREDWARERRLYQQRLARAKQDQRVDLVAKEAAEFDHALLRTAKAGFAVTANQLSRIQGLIQAYEAAAQAEPKRGDSEGFCSTTPQKQTKGALGFHSRVNNELEKLARAVTGWARLVHEALGDLPSPPPPNSAGELHRRIMADPILRKAHLAADARAFEGLGQSWE